jgi:hypothetical protein
MSNVSARINLIDDPLLPAVSITVTFDAPDPGPTTGIVWSQIYCPILDRYHPGDLKKVRRVLAELNIRFLNQRALMRCQHQSRKKFDQVHQIVREVGQL